MIIDRVNNIKFSCNLVIIIIYRETMHTILQQFAVTDSIKYNAYNDYFLMFN